MLEVIGLTATGEVAANREDIKSPLPLGDFNIGTAFDGDKYVGDPTDDYMPEDEKPKMPEIPQVGDGNVSECAKELLDHWGTTEMGANAILSKLHSSKKLKRRYSLREMSKEIVDYIKKNNLK